MKFIFVNVCKGLDIGIKMPYLLNEGNKVFL